MFDEKSFIVAVEESFRMYKEYGARSTEKLKPLHRYVADVMKSIWSSWFEVHYMGQDAKIGIVTISKNTKHKSR